jgi:broad specificity phosphatase PhoE
MAVRLTLICHAATRATREVRFPTDEALEPQELAATARLAPVARRIDFALTSPALRAVQTAAALGLSATVDAALADIALGSWAGRSLAEVEAADPSGLAAWMSDAAANPHGGETLRAVMARTAAWLDLMARREGRIVAVTHAAIMRAATLIILDAPPIAFWRIDVAPLCLASFQGRNGRWTLRSLAPASSGRPASNHGDADALW